MITVSLSNVLIINDDASTPWTNPELVGVPSVENSPTKKRAILSDASVEQFAQSMNNINFNFTYDFAMAIMKYDLTKYSNLLTNLFILSYDLWSNYPGQSPLQQRATMAYTMTIPAVCGPSRYSVFEFNGFNVIE
jgi:hypothetical protein